MQLNVNVQFHVLILYLITLQIRKQILFSLLKAKLEVVSVSDLICRPNS